MIAKVQEVHADTDQAKKTNNSAVAVHVESKDSCNWKKIFANQNVDVGQIRQPETYLGMSQVETSGLMFQRIRIRA